MPRGRPRKVPVVEEPAPSTVQQIIAKVISEECGIPGCMPKFHLTEAARVITTLEQAGYTIGKTATS
jgi:hypothetical protein